LKPPSSKSSCPTAPLLTLMRAGSFVSPWSVANRSVGLSFLFWTHFMSPACASLSGQLLLSMHAVMLSHSITTQFQFLFAPHEAQNCASSLVIHTSTLRVLPTPPTASIMDMPRLSKQFLETSLMPITYPPLMHPIPVNAMESAPPVENVVPSVYIAPTVKTPA
jgi:hypothetical protein